MDEIWLDIEKFPRYMVSSLGQVWDTKNSRIVKPQITRNGDVSVALRASDGRQGGGLVYLMMLRAFYPDHDENVRGRHIDEDRLNNNINNLEWTTEPRRRLRHDPFVGRHYRSDSYWRETRMEEN